MLKNKLFESVQPYIDEYLFGFDSSQMDLSVLKGTISLKDVNIRPNKVNQLFQQVMLPFCLKAATLGTLDIKINILQMWTGPIEVTIDEMCVVVGPNLDSYMSHDDSYINESDEDLRVRVMEPYDPSNMFNIFENQLKLKPKNKDQQANGGTKSSGQQSESNSLDKTLFEMMRNLKLKVNKVHVRYEDDQLMGGSQQPFAFGLTLDRFCYETSEHIWRFSQNHMYYEPGQIPRDLQDNESFLIKNLVAAGLSVYWNMKEQCILIPSSLWESTKHMENQIFDAIDIQDIKQQMKQVFNNKARSVPRILHSIDLLEKMDVCAQLQVLDEPTRKQQLSFSLSTSSALICTLNSSILSRVEQLASFCENYLVLRDLKQYRPHRKPLTQVPPEAALNPRVRRKRRLLVRDWFFYVVWYVRLRKLVRSVISRYDQQLNTAMGNEGGNTFDGKYREIGKILGMMQSGVVFRQQMSSEYVKQEKSLQIRLPGIKLRLLKEESEHGIEVEAKAVGFDFKTVTQSHQTFSLETHLRVDTVDLKVLEEKNHTPSLILHKSKLSLQNTHVQKPSFDIETSPPHSGSKISEMIQNQNEKANSAQFKINSVFQQDRHTEVTTHTKTQSFLGNFRNSQGNCSALVNLDAGGGARPPLPQSKRPHLLAAKGDKGEFTPVSVLDQDSGLFDSVFSKVLTIFNVDSSSKSTNYQEAGFTIAKRNIPPQPPAIIRTKEDHSQHDKLRQTAVELFKKSDMKNQSRMNQPAAYIQKRATYTSLNMNGKGSLNLMRESNSTKELSKAQKAPIKFDTITDDPIHQFMMSDNMSLVELKQTLSHHSQVVNQQSYASPSLTQASGPYSTKIGGIRNPNEDGQVYFKSRSTTQSQLDFLHNSGVLGDNTTSSVAAGTSSKPLGKPLTNRDYMRDILNKCNQQSKEGRVQAPPFKNHASFSGPIHTYQVTSNAGTFKAASASQHHQQNYEAEVGHETLMKLSPYLSAPSLDFSFKRHIAGAPEQNSISLNVQLGQVDIQYSNQKLKTVIEIFNEAMSNISAFRYLYLRILQNSDDQDQLPEKLIEVLLPFYVLNVAIFSQKLSQEHIVRLGKLLSFYFYNFCFASHRIQIVGTDNKEVFRFVSPEIIQVSLSRSRESTQGEILGFKFSGTNDFSLLTLFGRTLLSHLNILALNTAIDSGIRLYQKLKREEQQLNEAAASKSGTGTNKAGKEDFSKTIIQNKHFQKVTVPMSTAAKGNSKVENQPGKVSPQAIRSNAAAVFENGDEDHGGERLITELNPQHHYDLPFSIENLSAHGSEAIEEDQMFHLMQLEDDEAGLTQKSIKIEGFNSRNQTQQQTYLQQHLPKNHSNACLTKGAAAAVAVRPLVTQPQQRTAQEIISPPDTTSHHNMDFMNKRGRMFSPQPTDMPSLIQAQQMNLQNQRNAFSSLVREGGDRAIVVQGNNLSRFTGMVGNPVKNTKAPASLQYGQKGTLV